MKNLTLILILKIFLISEEFWNYMENYWHSNREFPESTEASLNRKADLVDGKVPSSQLPSYVDDVLEYDTFESLPSSGEKGKIYVITNNNTQFRWSGSEYIQLNSDEYFMTTNTKQNVTGKKFFITSGGNRDENNTLVIASLDHSLPGVTFYKHDHESGNINFNENGFNFVNGQASDYINTNAKGFKKSNSNDDYILTGGGGHKPISDFATTANLSDYVTTNTPQGIFADKTFAPTSEVSFLGSDVNHVNVYRSAGVYSIVSGHEYTHYDTKWLVGNKRGGSTDNIGYSFQFSSNDGATYDEKVLIQPDGNILTSNFGSASDWNAKVSQSQLAGYVRTTVNQNIDGIKGFTGAYTRWSLNDDDNNAIGFVQSLPNQFNIGTLNNKNVVIYKNSVEKIIVEDLLTTFYTNLSIPNAIQNDHAVNLGQMYDYTTTNYLPLSGGTMLGILHLNQGLVLNDPSVPQDWSIYQTNTGINFYVTGGNTQGDVVTFTQEGYVQASRFTKKGSSNDYLLLGGGGDKAISDFATSVQLGNYLPLSGGTLTSGGKIDERGNIIVQQGEVGGYATGMFWQSIDDTQNISGIGTLTLNGGFEYSYIGWGKSPWQTQNSLAISDSRFTYKNQNIWHEGNFNPNDYAGAVGNATAIGFIAGLEKAPYIYHSTAGNVRLARYDWILSQNYLNITQADGRYVQREDSSIIGVGFTGNSEFRPYFKHSIAGSIELAPKEYVQNIILSRVLSENGALALGFVGGTSDTPYVKHLNGTEIRVATEAWSLSQAREISQETSASLFLTRTTNDSNEYDLVEYGSPQITNIVCKGSGGYSLDINHFEIGMTVKISNTTDNDININFNSGATNTALEKISWAEFHLDSDGDIIRTDATQAKII
ncbi:hypothetical protein [Chryseobacterium mulctrae]|uniref:hypothetical protein n=1 Tax=Chryseobacterium mulctrae TaxID=2576777 RepID=UPI0011170794|nr:hypothetical protein [Chryseobacterium mulctrae]